MCPFAFFWLPKIWATRVARRLGASANPAVSRTAGLLSANPAEPCRLDDDPYGADSRAPRPTLPSRGRSVRRPPPCRSRALAPHGPCRRGDRRAPAPGRSPAPSDPAGPYAAFGPGGAARNLYQWPYLFTAPSGPRHWQPGSSQW